MPQGDRSRGFLARLGTIEPGEERATLLAATYFFFALASYFILRAVRDAAGVAAGTDKLPWLFMGTLVTTLVMNPVYSTIVSRLPVRRFIPIVYRVFIALLLTFAAIIKYGPREWEPFLGPTFWILTSIYSLFIPSVFWGFMADTFRPEQGKRLFGFISVGGTLGALAGAFLTSRLAQVVGTPVLMVMSVLLLECAVQSARRFPPSFRADTRARDEADETVGGSSMAGITHVLTSPYLLGISAYMLLFTIGSTVLYFQQAEIVGARYADREARTAFLASIDTVVQLLTVLAAWDHLHAVHHAGREHSRFCVTRDLEDAGGVCGVSGAAARRRVCLCPPCPRSAVHGGASGGPVQGEEFH
jgi:ATP:ADP antiporter, AAA family